MTVNVAFVLCDISISDEHFELAELSLCEEHVLPDEVSSDDGDEAAFDSAFDGSQTLNAAALVICAAECMLCLTKDDSVSIGLEISCEESLSDDFNGGCSTCRYCISHSFRDSINASINI
jgi:hypothetical protein